MPIYTSEQLQAINDHGKDILVSASAGSGKTTVLVQRVINEILAGTEVDQLLIITFTKAAAEVMKNRIKEELLNKLKDKTQNQSYLRRQLNKIDTANISTVDSFCLDIVHRFYYAIDLDPSFSILTDETQKELLKERALKDVENKNFENNDAEFDEFYDNFAGDRDVKDAKILLLNLLEKTLTKPHYKQWLNNLPVIYEVNKPLTNSKLWQNSIKPYLLTNLTNIVQQLDKVLDNSITLPETIDSKLTSYRNHIQNIEQAIIQDKNYNDLRESISSCKLDINFKKLGLNADEKEYVIGLIGKSDDNNSLRNIIPKKINKLYYLFFAVDEEKQLQVLKKAQKLMTTIVKVEEELIDRFNELKHEQNLIDFNDMEQMAYKILSQDTSSSHLAKDFYQSKFKEILVDEYQDINELQEGIIQQISNPEYNHLFMVGDVKQSIYGFRQAEPKLFLKKYHEFAKPQNTEQERILLSDNFRSTKPVTKIVNQLFNPLLTVDFGGIDYQKEGQLTFGAKYYPNHLAQASEVIFHEPADSKDPTIPDTETSDFNEIEMVIKRIKQFKKEKLQVFDGNKMRQFKYSDIAILTRSKSNNLQIMQEFTKHQIPLYITDAENYFQTFELTVIMNYLKIIDNPDQDIPLVTVLRSPLFNFDEKELAKIRVNNQSATYYGALLAYVSKNDALSTKIKSFLNSLSELRTFAINHRISELIWSIYERTNLLEIMTAQPNGEQRRVNLEALYERANSYESAGFKGLYQFVNFIERIRKSKKDLRQPLLTKEAGNAVKLMTIHGSKGLEFPIVFYVGLQHKFRTDDLSKNYIITNDSVGLTIKESEYRINSLVKSIANMTYKQQMLEEETRIMYVALTRAKQKLITVANIKKLDNTIKNWSLKLSNKSKMDLTTKIDAQTPLDLVGPGYAFDKQNGHYQTIDKIDNSLDKAENLIFIKYDVDNEQKSKITKIDNNVNNKNSLFNKIAQNSKRLFEYQYPFKDASRTTAYQAVSEIKKAFNDPVELELENAHLINSANRYLQPIDTKPNFLFNTKFTGAEIGTATHLILQYYDYSGVSSEAQLDQEIEYLISKKKLNPEIVPSINKDEILWFVQNKFTQKFWQHPNQLKREVDFSSLLSAGKLFSNFSDPQAKILVHGTIDGYYIDEDGIILFDYKTDHVDQNHLELAINKIKEKYTGQLRLYAQALNEFSKQKVKNKYLILLDAKKIVKID